MDPYIDPVTGVLRNRLGITDKVALAEAESDLAGWRTLELGEQLWPATGDLTELRVIHHHLFQDLYDWAGQVRVINMAKTHPEAELFLPWEAIENAAGFLARNLAEDEHLRGLSERAFVDRLTSYYEQLNYIHPFREGNGRTQRLFWSRVSHDAGWILDWTATSREVNDRACRAANDRADTRELREMFSRITHSRPARGAKTGSTDSDWGNLVVRGLDLGPSTTHGGPQVS